MSTMRPKKHRMLKQISLILMLIFMSSFGFAAKNVQAAVLVGTNSTLEGYNVDTKDWDGSYVTGNLGKSYGEGEWFPGRIRLTGFQGAYPSFVGMPDIQIKYDSVGSVSGGTAMFVDLVKGIQIGTRVLADTEAWPMANGLPYPMGSASNVALAQNHSGENQWAGYKLLNLPDEQMNRALDGTVGTIYENERMFIIKATDIIDALNALGVSPTTNDISIYFEFHLARTSIWSRNLQEYYTNEPAASWGGYLYGKLDFDPINFGSGPFPGSSGHFALANGGASDVPLPDTPEDYRTVTGKKFEDLNNNHQWDAGEPGIANWPIHLIGYIEDLLVPIDTTTNGSGVYSFGGLSMGSILEVTEGNVAGYVQTYPYEGTQPLANGATPVSISKAGRGPWGWKILGSLTTSSETVSGVDFGNFMPKPAMEVTKTGDAKSKAGDPVNYTITITNKGNVPLSIDSVFDSRIGEIKGSFLAVIPVGQSSSATIPYTIPKENTEDPFINKVTVKAHYLTYTVEGSASHSIDTFQPKIVIEKSVNKSEAIVGEKLTYTITVKNLSSTDTPKLTMTLTDALLGLNETFTMMPGDPNYVKVVDYIVKNTDPDPLNNTAKLHVTVEGFPNVYDLEDSARVDIIHPKLSIVKSGDALSKLGDDTKFTFLVKNEGDVPLTIESVKDDPFGDITAKFTKPTLQPGDSELLTLYFPIPLDAPDPFVNKVSAVYKYGVYVASAESSHSVNLFQPDFTITKEVNKTEAVVGEELTYTITIDNLSSTDTPKLTFHVTDPMLGLDETFTMMPADANYVKVLKYTVKETDPNPLKNTAKVHVTVEGFPNFYDKEASASVKIIHPLIKITKTGDALSKIGDETKFVFEVMNIGDVPLTLVSVIDDPFMDITSKFTKPVLQPGESEMVTLYFKIPADASDPFTNKVTATYKYGSYTATSSASHDVNLFQPSIELTKTVDKKEAIIGEKVTYTITIKNTSSADTPKLTLHVTDPLLGLDEIFTMLPGDPDYVKKIEYTIKETDPDPLDNTAKVHVTIEGFPNVIDKEDSARVDIIHPHLTIEKKGDALSKKGDDTKFTFLVKNDGDVPLTIESVVDVPFGDITAKFTNPLLAAGESELVTLYFPIPMDAPDPFVNKVTATYKYGSYTATGDSSHSVNLFQPDFSIKKTVNKNEAIVGEELTYTITIDNLSSADTPKLTFHVTDPLLGLDETFTMLPGDADYVKVLKYTVKETDPDPLVNTAKVHVTIEGFPNVIDKEASAKVNIIHPHLTIVKTGDLLSKIGDDTKFVFNVKNDGDVPLTLFSVVDVPFGDITSKFTKPILLPGESEMVTLYFKIPADAKDPFENKVTATYKYGDYAATSEDSHEVNLFQPDFTLTKIVDKSEAVVGEELTYTITIDNKSSLDTPLLTFHVTDPMLGLDETFTMLPADADYVKVLKYTVKAADPNPLKNTAKVHVTVEGFPNTYDKEASASVKIFHPRLTIVKSGDALSKLGDDTKFTFLVKNEGDVPLTLESVVDDPFGNITAKFTKPILQPGDSELVTLYFKIPMDAPDPFVNKVSATYKYGTYVASANSSYKVNLFQPDFTITKEVNKGEAVIGEELTYTITIDNLSSADTPKLTFHVTDPLLGLDETFTMLPADANYVKVLKYTVKETDPNPLKNTAKVHVTVEGFPNTYDKEASAQVKIVHPAILITKNGDALSKIGDDTKFVFTVKNIGDVPLTLVSVVDDPFMDITSKFTKPILQPGEEEVVTLYFKIPADASDPFTNKVTATYTYSTYTAKSSASHDVNLFQPKINLTKSVDKTVSMVGDTLTYTLKVENLSSPDTPIMNFTLTDSVLGALPPFSLKSGEVFEKSYPYLVTALDPNPIINVAEVSASPEGFPNVYTDKESTTVKLFTPLIKIEKFADTKISKVGDTINYTIRVTNMTVEAYAPNLVGKVTDPMLGLDSAINLASGQMVEFKIPYIVKAADDPGGFGWVDLKNTATVTVSPLGFEAIAKLTETASATVSLVHPAIDITKDVDKAEAMVGETVRFTITIKNTGDVKLENLKVTDTRMGDISAKFPSSLEVGQTATWFYDYILKLADISPDLLHPMVNWAEVHANPITLPNDIWDKDDASVLVKPAYYDETAWAYGGSYAVPFTDSTLFDSQFSKWGWTNGPLNEGDYTFILYAGAGQNILSKGIAVGTVTVKYHLGSATITYTMYPGMLIDEIHLYVGKLPLPKVKGSYTAAPGQFPINPKGVYGKTTWSITVKNLSGPIYVAAHMVVRIPGAVMPPILTPYYRPTV